MSNPTQVRLMNSTEWSIVNDVFCKYRDTLPFRFRIVITDALGLGGAPFTIPTSALSALAETLGLGFISGLAGLIAGTPVGGLVGFAGGALAGAALGYADSITNLGYLMNVGPNNYPDMSASARKQELLVHETTHVWQGKNSIFALSYVISSALSQCAGMLGGHGRGAAYSYRPGRRWSSYNAEQQAHIVQDWFAAGKPDWGPLWPYIRDCVRMGHADADRRGDYPPPQGHRRYA